MQATINHDELDATGLACPLPLLKVKQWLATAAPGSRLTVRATDPGSARDIPRYIAATEHQLETCAERDGVWTAVIRARPLAENSQ